MAESFFAALKNERVHRTQYPTREHARRDIVRYIEFWYNSRRRHSGLQYRTPQQVHEEYLERQSQRELTTNPLSGMFGADERWIGHRPAALFPPHGWPVPCVARALASSRRHLSCRATTPA